MGRFRAARFSPGRFNGERFAFGFDSVSRISTTITGLTGNAFHTNFVATGTALTAVPAELFDSVIWQHNGVDLPGSYNSLTETFTIGVDGVTDMGLIRLRGVKDGVSSFSPSYVMRRAAPTAGTLAAVSQTQGSGTPTVNLAAGFTGQALVYTPNQPWATVSGSTLTIADEARTGTVRIAAANSGGSAFVDLSVTIAAPVVASGLTMADNGDGTSTIVSISIPSLTLADNGDGTSTIEGF